MKFWDLNVYQKLLALHLEVHDISLEFPKFETYELGSQIRRSSNACAAILAEAFGNKHTNIYTEGISRSQGEIQESIHHLTVACRKKYITDVKLKELAGRYEECVKMLAGLNKALKA